MGCWRSFSGGWRRRSVEIIKTFEPRPVQVSGINYLVQDLLVLENGQEKRTTKCLGRESDFVKPGGHIIPASFYESSWATTEASLCPLEGDSGLDLDDHHELPQEGVSEALSVGDRVTHRLVPGLVAEITSVDTTKVKAHLLQVPPEREWLSQAQGWGWELSFAVKYLELVE